MQATIQNPALSVPVALEPRNLGRHGGSWRMLRDGIAGGEGWPLYPQRFAGRFGTES
jgi:hypothetical protein